MSKNSPQNELDPSILSENSSRRPEDQQNDAESSPNLVTKFTDMLSEKWESLSPENRVYFTQLGLCAAVQVVDTLTTHIGLQSVPGSRELNPISGLFLNNGGILSYSLVKLGVIAGEVTALEMVRRSMDDGEVTTRGNNILRLCNTFYTLVCASNISSLLMK